MRAELSSRLGRVGVWSWQPTNGTAAEAREGAAEVEALGYGALWYPEAVAKESFAVGATLLAWTQRIVVASGITNIYARDPTAAVGGANALADAYPGRFVLGLGASHAHVVQARGHEYAKPLKAMREYLEAMDSAPYRGALPPEPAPRLLAALGPKMLELAAERADGAHPYFVPVEHTAIARERLGPDRVLAVEQAVILDSDAVRARELAREHTSFYLRADNYRRSLLRLGFGEEELEGGGSERLVDAVVVAGDEAAIRERVRAHLEAGADHVCIQVLPQGSFQLEALRRLAPALVDL